MEFYERLSDIFEDDVDADTILRDLESYDSLSLLSVIAMVDKLYSVTITASDIRSISTAAQLKDMIEKKV